MHGLARFCFAFGDKTGTTSLIGLREEITERLLRGIGIKVQLELHGLRLIAPPRFRLHSSPQSIEPWIRVGRLKRSADHCPDTLEFAAPALVAVAQAGLLLHTF